MIIIRRLLISVLIFILLALMAYAVLVWNHNRTVPVIATERIQQSLELGISWLEKNQQAILADNNPMLWRMLQQSSVLSQDKRLQRLFSAYEKKYLDGRHNNIWAPLFYESSWVPVRYEQIRNLPYYNKHFIYSMTCDRDLADIAEIAAQNQPDFCDAHLLRPACATHQLMGIRIQQRKHCADADVLKHTVTALQQRIIRQLTWDVRLIDVYLQRVLMLLVSGAADQVKPVWIEQVISRQSAEGGWDNFEPLLGGRRAIGFSQFGIGFQQPRDTFHATIQGVYIMSLLLQDRSPD